MAQDVAQAVLIGFGIWTLTTLVLWITTGVSDGWDTSNGVLKTYATAWAYLTVAAVLIVSVILSFGVSV